MVRIIVNIEPADVNKTILRLFCSFDGFKNSYICIDHIAIAANAIIKITVLFIFFTPQDSFLLYNLSFVEEMTVLHNLLRLDHSRLHKSHPHHVLRI